jgi:hypothetical protein
LKEVLSITKSEMQINKSYFLAFMCGASGKSLAEATIQFGTIVITDIYAEKGLS